MPYILNATDFLAQAVIGFAIYLVLLRFWMQWVRADFRNELGQFIITTTNPLVIPLRKVLPSIKTLDTATLVLVLIIAFIKVFVFFLIKYEGSPTPVLYALMTLGVAIKYTIYMFMGAIIIQAIASWVNPQSYHPIITVARSISDPILMPVKRIIPPIANVDLSPIVIFLFLQFSLRLINPALLRNFPI